MASYSNPTFPLPLAEAVNVLIQVGNQVYVPEPPMEKEKALIWKSHVLISFSVSDEMHAFLGPLPDPNSNADKVREIFPYYNQTSVVLA